MMQESSCFSRRPLPHRDVLAGGSDGDLAEHVGDEAPVKGAVDRQVRDDQVTWQVSLIAADQFVTDDLLKLILAKTRDIVPDIPIHLAFGRSEIVQVLVEDGLQVIE